MSGDDIIRVDTGGALVFRAQGKPKGNAFGDKVGEWDSLRGQGGASNPQATTVFGEITDEQLLTSLARRYRFARTADSPVQPLARVTLSPRGGLPMRVERR